MTANAAALIELTACVDCLLALANADYTGVDLARETAVRSGLQRLANDGLELSVGDEHDAFSRTPCDVCLSPLAGQRHQVWALYRPREAGHVPPAAPGSHGG